MDIYFFFLCLGFCGLVAMTLLGFAHGHGGHLHGHASHGGLHTPSAAHGHGTHAHGAPAGAHHHSAWMLISPRVLFSMSLGFGAAGAFLRPILSGVFLFLAAAICGVIFERFLVQPLWRFLFGFASKPASTLENALLEDATAMTNFDATGHGLISVKIDGRIVQCLGALSPTEAHASSRVRAGDQLSIVAVDARRNSCIVAKPI